MLFSVAGGCPPSLRELPTGWRVLEREPNALVPHLWRDGILAARSERVALTSAEFALTEGWVEAAGRVDLERWVGVGGHIGAGVTGGLRWAVYLLRYRAFVPPGSQHVASEIPADNAVYRRSAILAHPDLLESGFWEPSFHKRFHDAGLSIGMDPSLQAQYVGQERGATFARRRLQHGRAFGFARGGHLKTGVLIVHLLATPILPGLLLGRIGAWSIREPGYRRAFITAFPWLVVFSVAWSVGEAMGYWAALAHLRSPGRVAPLRSQATISADPGEG